MKQNYLLIFTVFACFTISIGDGNAQTSQKNYINYQGVARDATGIVLSDTQLNIEISLKFGSENATTVYEENHLVTTDDNGVFSLRIGAGNSILGDYDTLSWGRDAAFITTTINGSRVGSTEMMAVPYALSSGDGQQNASQVPYDDSTASLGVSNTQEAIDALANSGTVDTDNQSLVLNNDILSIEDGTGTVDLSTYIEDADADTTNELQTLSFDTDTNELSLSNGNAITIPTGGTDADADPTNELQDISLTGTKLSISDGTTIDLAPIIPPGGTDDQNLELLGDVLSIEGGTGTVDLSTYRDDADADATNELQDISLSGTELSITDGAIIDLATILPPGGTDDQNLELNGDVLSIEGGTGTVDLSTYRDDADADPLNEVDVTAQTGILLGDGTNVIGLVGTADGQVPKWDATTSAWVPGDDEIATSSGGADELNDLSDAITNPFFALLFIGSNAGINNTTGAFNTAVGQSSFFSNTTGENNSAFGANALLSNTTGNGNSAFGANALISNITGEGNTANGYEALKENRTGGGNTANGAQALFKNEDGDFNTANGFEALLENTSGIRNTATGAQALSQNKTGEFNTAHGSRSLQFNTTGSGNTGNGFGTLNANTIGSSNTANGLGALGFNSSGNSNTATGYLSLYFNNIGNNNTANGTGSLHNNMTGSNSTGIGFEALYNNNADFNTALGATALRANTTGTTNTAVGSNALLSNTTGSLNTANGVEALTRNTTGNQNTAIGVSALFFNTTGGLNTANGVFALYNNTDGSENTANGANALRTNTTGENNTANGASALRENTTGSRNTGNGVEALLSNLTGSANTANGYRSLNANTTGENNTANGVASLESNSTGNRNTAIGVSALRENTIGSGNTAIGDSALRNKVEGDTNTSIGLSSLLNISSGNNNVAVGFRALELLQNGNNNLGIGTDAQVPNATGSNQIRLGNTTISYAGIQVAWTVTSDIRWKEKVRTLPYGLQMVSKLRPVDYTRKNNKKETKEIGFIAQEVATVFQELGYTDQGILSKDDQGYMSLRYNDFIPVLTKAIQEQQDIISKLKTEHKSLTSQLNLLQTKVEALVKLSNQNTAIVKTK